MIQTTVIQSGFARVSISGKYFNLVSASGIVEVELLKSGNQVFKSRMWVGMNISHPIDFDTVVMRGSDAPVEFWAGHVSTTQSGNLALKGANAIRTSVKMVTGEQPIVGSDLTRTAVRIRSNKEVFIGGSSFFGGGWRIAPNETVEVPVVGVLSAYKPLPFIDLSNSTDHGEIIDLIDSNNENGYISDDEQVRICLNSSRQLNVTIDGGVTWNITHSSVYGYVFDRRSGAHYLLRQVQGYFSFYRSDDGLTWDLLFRNHVVEPDGTDYSTSGYRAVIVGRKFQVIFSGFLVSFDIESGQHEVVNLQHEGLKFAVGHFIDDQLQTGLFGGLGDSTGMYRTTDGGKTFEKYISDIKYTKYQTSDDGKHQVYLTSTSRVKLSDDYGVTWLLLNSPFSNASDFTHVFEDIWLVSIPGYIYAVQIENGAASATGLTAKYTSYANETIYLNSNTFTAYTIGSPKSIKVALDIIGDLSAARVEVMELLN